MREKIEDLFDYRKFPLLMDKSTVDFDRHKFTEKLINLQLAIYHLDQYLETNWTTSDSKLDKYWKNIHRAMESLGYSLEKSKTYTKQILKYQKHELYLRKYRMPSSLDMEYYYYYKSCDVKLLRRIIVEQLTLSRSWSNPQWRLFDLVTEINDDIEDVHEDLDTINGNSFLLGIMYNGKETTHEKFRVFIEEVLLHNELRLTKYGNPYKLVHNFTSQEGKNTLKFLKKQINEIQQSEALSKAVIHKYMQGKVLTL